MLTFDKLLKKIKADYKKNKKLNLAGYNIDDSYACQLASTLKQWPFETIDLSSNHLSNIAIESLVPSFTNVRILNLSNNDINHLGMEMLARLHLTELNISHNPIGDKGVEPLVNHETLMILTLEDCDITPNGANRLFNNGRLVKLFLNNNTLDKSEGFENLTTNTTLQELSLQECHLTHQCVVLIARNTGLRKVDLSTNNLGPRAAQCLATENCAIEELDLSQNRIGDQGIGAFAKNTSVKKLKLMHNGISSEGIKQLSRNRALVYLDLSFNTLDDNAAKYLVLIKTLTEFSLLHNRLTLVGVAILSEAFKEFFDRKGLKSILAYNPIDFQPEYTLQQESPKNTSEQLERYTQVFSFTPKLQTPPTSAKRKTTNASCTLVPELDCPLAPILFRNLKHTSASKHIQNKHQRVKR